MLISIIAAMSLNRVIGKNNRIPWHIPGEQQRFKQITWSHTILMGRKTYESIGKALPGRTNIVITRQENYSAPGCIVAHSLEQALESCPPNETEAFIIGGEQIFRLALPVVQRICLTTIQTELEGDAFFPELSPSDFKATTTELIDAPIPYSFSILERIAQVEASKI